MIQIDYKCTKKDYIRVFANWSHRSIEGNFTRVILLLAFIILGKKLVSLNRELLLIFQGRYGSMVVFSLIVSCAIIFLLFISIFFFANSKQLPYIHRKI